MEVVRSSKFRHVFGTQKKHSGYDALRVRNDHVTTVNPLHYYRPRSSRDATILRVNNSVVGVQWETTGFGALAVLPVRDNDTAGKIPAKVALKPPLIEAYKTSIQDFDFNPFNDGLLATADSATIKFWNVPTTGLTESITVAHGEIPGKSSRRILMLNFHPTIENMLTAVAKDNTVTFFDVSQTSEVMTVQTGHADAIQSVSWNFDSSRFVSSSKDKKMKIFDPRGNTTVSEVEAHESVKGFQALWLGQRPHIITNGFAKTGERKISIWDTRKFTAPLQTETLATSPGLMNMFYDESTDIVFLAGKGDNSIRYYEVVDDAPFIHFLSQYTGPTNQTDLVLFPKRIVDVNSCEVFRFAKLAKDKLEHIMFQVPRKDVSGAVFHEDLYHFVDSGKPATTISKWKSGAAAAPVFINPDKLKPAGATSIFEIDPDKKYDLEDRLARLSGKLEYDGENVEEVHEPEVPEEPVVFQRSKEKTKVPKLDVAIPSPDKKKERSKLRDSGAAESPGRLDKKEKDAELVMESPRRRDKKAVEIEPESPRRRDKKDKEPDREKSKRREKKSADDDVTTENDKKRKDKRKDKEAPSESEAESEPETPRSRKRREKEKQAKEEIPSPDVRPEIVSPRKDKSKSKDKSKDANLLEESESTKRRERSRKDRDDLESSERSESRRKTKDSDQSDIESSSSKSSKSSKSEAPVSVVSPRKSKSKDKDDSPKLKKDEAVADKPSTRPSNSKSDISPFAAAAAAKARLKQPEPEPEPEPEPDEPEPEPAPAKREGVHDEEFKDGSKYHGNFKNDSRHGMGTFECSQDKSSYKGEWAEGLKSGNGILTLQDGSEFKGPWRAGIKATNGIYSFPDKSRFEGDYKQTGKTEAKFVWDNGDTYVGAFLDGLKHGKGKLSYKDGSVYNGDWKNDVREGRGEYVFSDGSKYKGEFKDDVMHGEGTFTEPFGQPTEGVWQRGKIVQIRM